MTTTLLVGAHSAIAQALAARARDAGDELLLWTRNAELDGATWVGDVLHDELPSLPDRVDRLAYFPGSLDLKPFGRTSLDTFRGDWELSVLGFVRVVQHALPALRASDAAAVVAISTVAATTGMPFHTSIAQAKGALEALVRSLAAEFAPHIRFNAVAPSLTDTPLAGKLTSNAERREKLDARHPLARIGTPDDIAAALEFLLGTESSWMTGQVLAVDGGIGVVRS